MATILYAQRYLLQYYFSELIFIFYQSYVGKWFKKKKKAKQYRRAYNVIKNTQVYTFLSQSGLQGQPL